MIADKDPDAAISALSTPGIVAPCISDCVAVAA
jgi:hypothetical protein